MLFSGEKNNQNNNPSINEDILAVFAYLIDGVLVFDSQANVSLVNPQAEKFLEVKSSQVLGIHILGLNRFPNFKPIVNLLGGGMEEISRKTLQISEKLILEVSVISMAIKSSKIGSLVILHDVTKEKSIERMKSEFVTIAAHKLRTPASIVKWTTQVLLSGDLGKLNPKQKEAVNKAFLTNEHMIKLVNDLLNIAEIEEGKYLSKMALSDFGEVARSAINDFQKDIDEKKLNFKIYMPEKDMPKVMLDAEKMKIALGNIISNSIKYSSSGKEVKISISASEKEILFQIEDSGLGIDENDHDKVFTKFFRGANLMKVETEGSGLGLYIAKNIIEAHGGRIWFNSKKGKGATFFFSIPLKEKFGQFVTKDFY